MRFRAALAFVTAWFAVELALAGVTLASGPVKLRLFAGELTALAFARWGWFLARVYFCHLCGGFLLALAEAAFAVRRRFGLYACVVAYALLFNLLRNPQIFDDVRVADALFFALTAHLNAWALLLPALAFLALLWRTPPCRVPAALLVSGAVLAAAIWQVRAIEAPRFSPAPVVPGPAPRGAVVLSVDSLRADGDLAPPPGSALATLLDHAYVSHGLVAAMAQTHGSLTSLLTGLYPPRHGVRHPLAKISLTPDDLLRGSAAEALAHAGIEVRLLRDANEHDILLPSRAIPLAHEPGDGFTSMVMPFFLRNRFWAAFFNNDLGFAFLPEVRANATFSYLYRLEYFTDEVARELADLKARGKPFLLVVHSCALHWPGSFPFPYYPPTSEGGAWARYAYSNRYGTGPVPSDPVSPARAVWLRDLYARGVRYLTDRFLVPLSEELTRQGFTQTAAILITSDHGEAFTAEKRDLPQFPFPQHGSTLLFGADSERAYLRLVLPGERGREIPGFLSNADLLPTLGDWFGVKMPDGLDGRSFVAALGHGPVPERGGVYSETGLWPLPIFRGQFILDARAYSYFYHLTPDARHVFVGPENEAPIVAEKQRALLWDHYRLTVFPTSFGTQYFLCDLRLDPECHRDASRSEARALATGLRELGKIVAPDEARGFVPALRWEAVSDRRILRRARVGRSAPDLYLAGLEQIYRTRDYAGGARTLDSLIGRADAPVYLQAMAARELFGLCQLGALPDSGPQFHFKSWTDLEALGAPPVWVRDCAGAYAAPAAAARVREPAIPREIVVTPQPDAAAYELPQELEAAYFARYRELAAQGEAKLTVGVMEDLKKKDLPLRYRFVLDAWVDRRAPRGPTVAQRRRALVREGRKNIEEILDKYRLGVARGFARVQ